MDNLQDIIKYENECTEIDFKKVQYKKMNHESFLKDIMSLANGRSKNNKYIIIGVKHFPNGERDIVGVEDDFVDEATYQQLIHTNIEPEIKFKYYAFDYEGKKIGVFEILDCSNPPYLMKKDFGKLRLGDGYIRKGPHQMRLTRADYDAINKENISDNSFQGELEIYFNEKGSKEIEVKVVSLEKTPSEINKKKIAKVIEEKERIIEQAKGVFVPPVFKRNDSFYNTTSSYEDRSIETLKENLKNVKNTYLEHDVFYIFEFAAHRLNFNIFNSGDEYIEDASIEVTIPRENRMIEIADRIYEKPVVETVTLLPSYLESKLIEEKRLKYPSVRRGKQNYIISENLGNLKHNIETSAFIESLRIAIWSGIEKKKILVKVKVFGKNLKKPIEDELILKLV